MTPQPVSNAIHAIDAVVHRSLCGLAADSFIHGWYAKEHNWVSYFVFRHLLQECAPDGVLWDPAQIGIEVNVPQPPGYPRPTVCRDIVIWPEAGMTCWKTEWSPAAHPLAIIEWKTHRGSRRNRRVKHERAWLRAYCNWQPSVVGYAVAIDVGESDVQLTCTRYCGDKESKWFSQSCTTPSPVIAR